MKLDKMQFAMVVAHCVSNGMSQGEYEVKHLDSLIDIEVPEAQVVYPKNESIEALMRLMVAGTSKVDAIREHRSITGMGLKESKEAVERYWVSIKPNSYTYTELKAKINEEFSAGEQETIMRFLNKL